MPNIDSVECRLLPHSSPAQERNTCFALPPVKEYHDPEYNTPLANFSREAIKVECDVAVEDFTGHPFAVSVSLGPGYKWPNSALALYLNVYVDGVYRRGKSFDRANLGTGYVFWGYGTEQTAYGQKSVTGLFEFKSLEFSENAPPGPEVYNPNAGSRGSVEVRIYEATYHRVPRDRVEFSREYMASRPTGKISVGGASTNEKNLKGQGITHVTGFTGVQEFPQPDFGQSNVITVKKYEYIREFARIKFNCRNRFSIECKRLRAYDPMPWELQYGAKPEKQVVDLTRQNLDGDNKEAHEDDNKPKNEGRASTTFARTPKIERRERGQAAGTRAPVIVLEDSDTEVQTPPARKNDIRETQAGPSNSGITKEERPVKSQPPVVPSRTTPQDVGLEVITERNTGLIKRDDQPPKLAPPAHNHSNPSIPGGSAAIEPQQPQSIPSVTREQADRTPVAHLAGPELEVIDLVDDEAIDGGNSHRSGNHSNHYNMPPASTSTPIATKRHYPASEDHDDDVFEIPGSKKIKSGVKSMAEAYC